MYTSHLSQPTGPKDRSEYFMNQLNTWGMTGNLKTFLQGVTAYRNARDWAKEKRKFRFPNGRALVKSDFIMESLEEKRKMKNFQATQKWATRNAQISRILQSENLTVKSVATFKQLFNDKFPLDTDDDETDFDLDAELLRHKQEKGGLILSYTNWKLIS